jgi:hypothetical protein
MNKPSSRYDHRAETSPFLTALAEARLECNRAEHVMPHAKMPGSLMLVEAIESAIDDYGEPEMGHRGYFWGQPHSAGCKHA